MIFMYTVMFYQNGKEIYKYQVDQPDINRAVKAAFERINIMFNGGQYLIRVCGNKENITKDAIFKEVMEQ